MSVLRKEIRAWWIEKPLGHNIPTDVVFEDFKPTVTNAPGREWIRVISLDDFHSSTNINITRYVELCKELVKSRKQNEIMREALADIMDSYFDIPPELRMQKGLRECERSKRARKALKQIKEIEG